MILAGVFRFLIWLPAVQAVTLKIATSGGNASSPHLYGIMFEDINNSGDGGIHGQLLRNNGFQGDNASLTAYSAVGGTTLSVDTANPLSTAITKSLKVAVPSGATGQVGFSNVGYLGVPVNEGTYTSSFWMKGDYSGDVTVSLLGPTGTVYAQQTVAVTSNSSAFGYYSTTFTSKQSFETNNVWNLTFDATKAQGSALYFDLVQLFPETYKQRSNGLRNDVMSYLEPVQPSFLRFPGGNNLEGQSPATRWKWNETIGPLHMRPGRQGDWGYPNTDALGLMEYLDWCSDMKMTPVLAVWSGLSLGGGNGSIVSGDPLKPYITDILNELEFLFGSASTTYGALRVQYGHPDPYNIPFLEVGNEDMFAGGCTTYPSRFTDIYNAVHAAYPNLTIIASTSDKKCLPSKLPAGVWTDTHHYLSPNDFVKAFNEWDNVDRSHGVMVGEYASTVGNDGTTTYWSNLQGSVGEAVYMIGMERNSDVVKMASFAPLFEHFDMAQWSPDLFGVNSTTGSITGSTSFWVQHMFSSNRGSTILPVTADAGFGPVYWVASKTDNGTYYVKLANYGDSTQPVTVAWPSGSFSGAATVTMLSGPQLGANYPGIVTIEPKTSQLSGSASAGYKVSMPAYSVAVLAVSGTGSGSSDSVNQNANSPKSDASTPVRHTVVGIFVAVCTYLFL